MRSSQQETMAYTKSRQTQHTVKPQQETVDAQSFLPPQRYPLAQTISRISNTPSASTHAAILNRSSGVGQSSNRQLVLQLQRQFGNRYVNQVVQMARREEALQTATSLKRDELMKGEAEAVGEGIGVSGVRQENKTGLPDNLKAGIENLSGISMDDVKVHYNSSNPAQLQALAYTQGTDIYVGSGQEKHLPHEAWHVVQQKKGQVKPTMQAKGVAINDEQSLEREADLMGTKAFHMKQAHLLPTNATQPSNSHQQNRMAQLQENINHALLVSEESIGKKSEIEGFHCLESHNRSVVQLKKIKDYPLLMTLGYKIGWTDGGMFGKKPYVMFFTGTGGEHLKFHANTKYLMENLDHVDKLSQKQLPTDLRDLEFDEFHLTTESNGQVMFDENGNIKMLENEAYRERAQEVIGSYIKVLGAKAVNLETGESVIGIDL